MTKELEALERIETTFSMNKQGKKSVYREYTNSIYPYYEDFDLVLNALQRLESIDNANPSEALEKFDYIGNDIKFAYDDDYVSYDYTDDVEYIKQALLKAQEQEKVLEIIKEKPFESASCIHYLKINKNYPKMLDYKHYCMAIKYTLAEEEFELFKEVLE